MPLKDDPNAVKCKCGYRHASGQVGSATLSSANGLTLVVAASSRTTGVRCWRRAGVHPSRRRPRVGLLAAHAPARRRPSSFTRSTVGCLPGKWSRDCPPSFRQGSQACCGRESAYWLRPSADSRFQPLPTVGALLCVNSTAIPGPSRSPLPSAETIHDIEIRQADELVIQRPARGKVTPPTKT